MLKMIETLKPCGKRPEVLKNYVAWSLASSSAQHQFFGNWCPDAAVWSIFSERKKRKSMNCNPIWILLNNESTECNNFRGRHYFNFKVNKHGCTIAQAAIQAICNKDKQTSKRPSQWRMESSSKKSSTLKSKNYWTTVISVRQVHC